MCSLTSECQKISENLRFIRHWILIIDFVEFYLSFTGTCSVRVVNSVAIPMHTLSLYDLIRQISYVHHKD